MKVAVRPIGCIRVTQARFHPVDCPIHFLQLRRGGATHDERKNREFDHSARFPGACILETGQQKTKREIFTDGTRIESAYGGAGSLLAAQEALALEHRCHFAYLGTRDSETPGEFDLGLDAVSRAVAFFQQMLLEPAAQLR